MRKPAFLKWVVYPLVLTLAVVVAGALLLAGVVIVKLSHAWREVPAPQVILVLEGDTNRVSFAAEFARSVPNLPIWISGNPGGEQLNRSIFQQAGIAPQRLHFEFCASDTVTHFTCNARDFAKANTRHVYMVTSDQHIPRAKAIATLVFGSHGIAVTPVSATTSVMPPESLLRIIRDCVRSVLWIVTGRTGASLNPKIQPH